MIGRLRGIILEKNTPLLLVEVNGIGYEVNMPMSCFRKLPELGKEVVIFTHFLVREDAQKLYGFNSRDKCVLFKELIKTSGIGPKLGLVIVSEISVQKFVNAVESKNYTALTKYPGIGKKTAERLIIEIGDRFKRSENQFFTSNSVIELSDGAVMNGSEQEAMAALISLGYKSKEASHMVAKVSQPEASSEVIIRKALRMKS